MTRTAVLSDIHGNLPALEAVTADAEARGCTHFLNLGDILSGPLWPAETADWLMQRDWPTIAGNHERQVLTLPAERMGSSDSFARQSLSDRHLAWMESHPPLLALEGMLLCHGTPDSDIVHLLHSVDADGIREATHEEVWDRLGERRERLTLCGHTHLARALALRDGRIVANPGSVGLQAFDDDYPSPYRVENGDPRARYAIMEQGQVTLHAVAYDHETAAAKAAHEGRDDWAVALRTGRM